MWKKIVHKKNTLEGIEIFLHKQVNTLTNMLNIKTFISNGEDVSNSICGHKY
jgi:hypothetical protein